jgi:hypothetical protein
MPYSCWVRRVSNHALVHADGGVDIADWTCYRRPLCNSQVHVLIKQHLNRSSAITGRCSGNAMATILGAEVPEVVAKMLGCGDPASGVAGESTATRGMWSRGWVAATSGVTRRLRVRATMLHILHSHATASSPRLSACRRSLQLLSLETLITHFVRGICRALPCRPRFCPMLRRQPNAT